MKTHQNDGWNPYLCGALSGLTAVVSLYLTGHFFGASTTFVRSAGMIEKLFLPERVGRLEYFVKTVPKIDWQWMFVAGIFAGALLASLAFKEFRIQAVPEMWKQRFGPSALKRGIIAFCGGVIAICGARLADGCPSGHGLSGLMQLAVSGFIALLFFFIGGIVSASLFYKGGKR